MALLPANAGAGRRALAACFEAAHAASDVDGQRLAAAGSLIAIAADYADFRGLAHWLERLPIAQRASWPRCARAQDQARLDAALVSVPMLDGGIDAEEEAIESAAQRLAAALGADLAVVPDERVLLWKCLYDYRAHRLDTTALTRIAAQAQDFLRRGSVSPLWQASWWLLAALNHEYFGAPDAAADCLDRAHRLTVAHGLASVRYELLCVEMTAALKAQAWGRSDAIAREIEVALPDIQAGRHRAGYHAQAWRLMWRGEPATALRRLDRALAICDEVEIPLRDRGTYHVLRAYALMDLERFDEALATLQSQQPHQRGDQGEVLAALIDFAAGLGRLQRGEDGGRERVLRAIGRCAALDFDRFLLPLPSLAARAAQIALEAGVHTEFVTRVVRNRKLVPADPARQEWPWRLQVHVLGPELVLRDGQPLAPLAKRPRKPLQLLALLAAQGSKPLSVDLAIELLWPSTDAESPKGSFEVALARLRKLLDLPGVILLTDGRLHFDAPIVWTDVAAFEIHEQRWLAGCHAPSEGARAEAVSNAQAAMVLYRGALLAGEELSAPWQLLREQLARRFSRLVIECGALLESQGRWREAHDAYERGIAYDTLSEPTYRALMRVQLQLGEHAEALRTFALCRNALEAALGAVPARETWALQQRAQGTGG